MKKVMIAMMCSAVMLNSCGTTESGAYNGAWFGSILGSAIGGISDGPRGSDWGTIIGMAGGAVVGGAIGNAKEKATKEKLDRYHERIEQKERARYDSDHRGYEVRGTRTARAMMVAISTRRTAATTVSRWKAWRLLQHVWMPEVSSLS